MLIDHLVRSLLLRLELLEILGYISLAENGYDSLLYDVCHYKDGSKQYGLDRFAYTIRRSDIVAEALLKTARFVFKQRITAQQLRLSIEYLINMNESLWDETRGLSREDAFNKAANILIPEYLPAIVEVAIEQLYRNAKIAMEIDTKEPWVWMQSKIQELSKIDKDSEVYKTQLRKMALFLEATMLFEIEYEIAEGNYENALSKFQALHIDEWSKVVYGKRHPKRARLFDVTGKGWLEFGFRKSFLLPAIRIALMMFQESLEIKETSFGKYHSETISNLRYSVSQLS